MKASEYNGYKLGALKRRFKTGRVDLPPGTFISKANEVKLQSITKKIEPMSDPEKVSIMGAV